MAGWFYRTIRFGTWAARANGRSIAAGYGCCVTPSRSDLAQISPDENAVYIHGVWDRDEALSRVRIELAKLAGQDPPDVDAVD